MNFKIYLQYIPIENDSTYKSIKIQLFKVSTDAENLKQAIANATISRFYLIKVKLCESCESCVTNKEATFTISNVSYSEISKFICDKCVLKIKCLSHKTMKNPITQIMT